jgi:hypothetical protein
VDDECLVHGEPAFEATTFSDIAPFSDVARCAGNDDGGG